jgi:hypothetical protein
MLVKHMLPIHATRCRQPELRSSSNATHRLKLPPGVLLQVRAIQSYEGAVVVASHDLRFVQDVVYGQAGGPEGVKSPDSGSAVRTQPEAQGLGVGLGQGFGEVFVLKGAAGISKWDAEGGVMAYAEKVLAKVVKQQGSLLQQRASS